MRLFRVDDRDRAVSSEADPSQRIKLGLVELVSVDQDGNYDNKTRIMVSPEVIREAMGTADPMAGKYFQVELRPVAKKVTFEVASALRRGV